MFTDNKKIVGQYVNGNHRTFLYDDGTKLKETGYYINETGPDGSRVNRWVDVDTNHMTYEFPENFDIKITDKCNAGCKPITSWQIDGGKNGNSDRL